jgi:hypothetical protein
MLFIALKVAVANALFVMPEKWSYYSRRMPQTHEFTLRVEIYIPT